MGNLSFFRYQKMR